MAEFRDLIHCFFLYLFWWKWIFVWENFLADEVRLPAEQYMRHDDYEKIFIEIDFQHIYGIQIIINYWERGDWLNIL